MKKYFVNDPIVLLEDAGFFMTADGFPLRRHLAFPPSWKKGDPLLVLLQGRAESLDKYDRMTAFFLEKGLAVFRLDWRGQGGSGRMLTCSDKGHIDDFGRYISDLEEVVTREILPLLPGKLIFCGHSMGGHLTLRYLLEGGKMDASILVSPMMSIHLGALPEQISRPIIGFMARNGFPEQKVPGRSWLDKRPKFLGNRLTRDPENFYRFRLFLSEHPSMEIAEPTWAWVHEAFRSMDMVWKSLETTRPDIPVLVFSGGGDRVVKPLDHARLMNFLKNGTCRVFQEARHELMMEKKEIVRAVQSEMEVFFKKHHLLNDGGV